MSDEQTAPAGLSKLERGASPIGFGLKPGEYLQWQGGPRGEAEQLGRAHGTHERAVLDGGDGRDRHATGSLRKLRHLALAAWGQIARRVGQTRNGFGMAE